MCVGGWGYAGKKNCTFATAVVGYVLTGGFSNF
jgi:hypothetical protein